MYNDTYVRARPAEFNTRHRHVAATTMVKLDGLITPTLKHGMRSSAEKGSLVPARGMLSLAAWAVPGASFAVCFFDCR